MRWMFLSFSAFLQRNRFRMVLMKLVFIFSLSELVRTELVQKYYEYKIGKSIVSSSESPYTSSAKACIGRCSNTLCTLAEFNETYGLCRLGTGLHTNLADVFDDNLKTFILLNMCSNPETPEHGSAVVTNGRSICTFTCNPGYTLTGPTSVQCVEGIWYGVPPICEEIDECISSPCMNGSTCNNMIDGYTCKCIPGYTGTHCETEIDECTSSPCQNGATCMNLINAYSCTCPVGFTGQNCAQETDECRSSPCQNGGICVDNFNGYTCACSVHFTGTHCEQDVDECLTSPCQNGGTCINQFGSYTCSCIAGFTGMDCEQDVDECLTSPCLNGGTCSNQFGSYTCSCITGFTGMDCEQDVDECLTSPCLNGGTCSNQFGSYTCSCIAGFTGMDCEQDVDECLTSPCLNGGTCSNQFGSYTCSCITGFTGMDCEQDISACASFPCMNEGTCIAMTNSYTCSCSSLFTGIHCEQDCYPGTPWEYNGLRNWTETGRACQRWDSQVPHPHHHTDLQYFPDATLAEAGNYCRNPEPAADDMWCMTSDPNKEWEFCNIIPCV